MTEGRDLLYLVEGMSCEHCERAVTEEVMRVDGVRSVAVDLSAKRVRVGGDGVGDAAVRAAIAEAGYEAVAL
jgi:copper chaperone CopZ